MNRVGYWIIRLVAESFRLVPFWLLYRLSDGMAFIMQYAVRYRKKVMEDNLRRAFPEKNDGEIAQLIHSAYRNLTDITLETLKGFTAPLPELLRRCEYTNIELMNAPLRNGQSIIVAGAHVNNWEWLCFTVPQVQAGNSVCVYKKLSNPFVDTYYNARRARGGMTMIEMEDTYAAMKKLKGTPSSYCLLADQSPSSIKSAHWVRFFGQETAFLPGIEFLSRRFQMPVIYYHVERVKRGYYRVSFIDICADAKVAGPQEITQKYAEVVENAIRSAPENWLWSHKRWKHKRPIQ